MKERLMKKFEELFGSTEGAGFYFSPGRVNLIGEHTDYNGGHVFPCALTLGTYGIAKKRSDRILRLYSMNLDHLGVITATLDDLTNKPEYNWANYPLGVLWALKEKGYNPVNQLVGYLISGDPSYITSYNGARALLRKLERDEILEEVIKSYLEIK